MPAGRPLAFESVEDLSTQIDTYFVEGGPAYIDIGDATMFVPTVSGLAYHLNVSTETLRDYGTKEEYSATVKRAKQKIEIALEQRLAGQAVTGTIFNLKNNFGWKDKTEKEITGNLGLTDLSEAELKRKIKHLETLNEQSVKD